jgi:hypothetical protein
MTELERFIAERNAKLSVLDMEWARSQLPHSTSDDVLLLSMHKARYDCTGITAALRLESGEWLRARGFSRLNGLPLAPPGVLP